MTATRPRSVDVAADGDAGRRVDVERAGEVVGVGGGRAAQPDDLVGDVAGEQLAVDVQGTPHPARRVPGPAAGPKRDRRRTSPSLDRMSPPPDAPRA